MKRFSILAAAGIGAAMLASSAYAQTPIAYFNNPSYPYPAGNGGYANYGAWGTSSTTFSNDPNGWEVNSTGGYGSNYFSIYGSYYGNSVSLAGDSYLELQVDVISGLPDSGAFIVDLYDGDSGGSAGWEWNMGTAVGPGQYTFYAPIDQPTSPDGYEAANGNPAQISYNFGGTLLDYFDPTAVVSYHLQLPVANQASGAPDPYDVVYESFQGVVSVPEPASFGMAAAGCALLLRRRRNAMASK